MRIGVAQVTQETNTFNPLPTTRQNFESFGLMRGPEVIEKMRDTSEPGGFIQSLLRWPEKPEPVGLVRLMAWPSGRATRETFDWLRDELVAPLKNAGPLDGLLLSLHGAMAAEGHPDVEGDLLEAVRGVVGPSLPVVATLDLHAHLTPKMVKNADVLVIFHTAPHIDVFETGVRGAAVLRRLLVDKVRPTSALVRIPMVPPAERANTQHPSSASYAFRERLQALEARPEVLSAGLTTVQPWLDVPELGSAVLVTTAGDAALAEREGRSLAGEVWARREEYLPELVPAEEAVRIAHETTAGLVVLSDAADATTSGAPGDSTWVLRELLKYPWPRGAAVTFVAPEIVEQAESAGPGATLSVPLGGKRDARFSTPVPISARVERLFDTQFVLSGHLAKNLSIDMGRSALLSVGDVRIIVTSRSGPHFAPELFRMAGLDPFELNVLVAKSPCGFRAAYEARAAKIMSVKAPGCAPSDFWNYEYPARPHPLWPWEAIDGWQPEIAAK
jgi:microcystin degradation protein MlrC